MSDIETGISAIVEELKTKKAVLVYGFGSFAEGRLRPDSDIDIAYLTEEPVTPLENFELAQDLAVMLHRDVDLVPLRDASTVLRSQVVKNGKRLYAKNERLANEFEMYVLSDYARLNEERRRAGLGGP